MPSLIIPESGLTIGGASSKNASFSTEILGLTLADSVIEEMIRCVQNRKPIQLSLGDSPSISYGTKTQHLSTSDDPFTTDIFSTDLSTKSMAPAGMSKKEAAMYSMFRTIPKRFVPVQNPLPKTHTKTSSISDSNTSETAGSDAALAALQNSLASENAKKAEHSIKYIKDGSLSLPGKKGGKSNKNKFLSQTRSLHDTTRSMPSSPALSGVGSPALGPTSAPLSQQKAEQAKADRKPLIHLLAAQPWTEIGLREELPDFSSKELKEALQKVGDVNDSTGKWELRQKLYKELDVWNFQYSQVNDRQRAIDNAIKVFDKMRLATSEPEWERLLPKNERGTGKCLSKVQAKIAAGPPPKISVSKAADSGRDTPNGEEEDSPGDKHVSKSKGETMARSVSQPLANKPKKTSEKEAQAKRLLSKKPAAPKPATKSAPAKKSAVPKPGTKVLSSEYVHDSDEDDSPAPTKPLPKVTQKRARNDEDVESSDSSIPLSKKVKKDAPLSHRVSDASQISRTTTNSSHNSTASTKTKSNSPQKSSPLASSPPTNASDFEDQSSGERTSSSASPPHVSTKNSRSPIHKRHGKTSSVSSSNSSSSRYLKQEVTDLARRYRLYYPKYEALHKELSGMNGQRDKQKERNLLEMHARLESMKKEILAGIVDGDSS